jgi:phosphate:Na+ symporter
MSWDVVGALLGGIGLFLLGMRLMTDGLRLAAGRALKSILAAGTGTPARSLASGFAVTAAVQSSSAVTVAVIGFVNAGLLSLYDTLWVIYGSNIGTTVTGWLVALIGFKVNVKALALPLIGAGMALNVSSRADQRRGAIGEAMAGFGLFFLGVDILKTGFTGLNIDFAQAAGFSVWGCRAAALGIGAALTVIMQSSSAAMAVVLAATAMQGDAVGPICAAAAVVGANLGTTSTAALAAIGATAPARRVAAGHVLFNVITAGVAFALLPVLVGGIERVAGLVGLVLTIPTLLALFHTVFNILGIVVVGPFTSRIARGLNRRFASRMEELARPRYLDKTISGTPSLAFDAVGLELSRMAAIGREATMAGLGGEYGKVRPLSVALESLERSVNEFVTDMQRVNLDRELAVELPFVLRAAHYCVEAAGATEDAGQAMLGSASSEDEQVADLIAAYRAVGEELAGSVDPCGEGFDLMHLDALRAGAEARYKELKAGLLLAGAESRLSSEEMGRRLEWASRMRRALNQLSKASIALARIIGITQNCPKQTD